MRSTLIALIISLCILWACDTDGHERVDTGKCHDGCPKCEEQKVSER